jgi:hypothetical protein
LTPDATHIALLCLLAFLLALCARLGWGVGSSVCTLTVGLLADLRDHLAARFGPRNGYGRAEDTPE